MNPIVVVKLIILMQIGGNKRDISEVKLANQIQWVILLPSLILLKLLVFDGHVLVGLLVVEHDGRLVVLNIKQSFILL